MIFDPEELVRRYEKQIVMASFLYYNSGKSISKGKIVPESPITDEAYDSMVKFVVANWSMTSPEFRKRITKEELSASGFLLKATKKEIKAAFEWANKND